MNYYGEKKGGYFTGVRNDLTSLLPPQNDLHILESGAGGGETLMELKRSEQAPSVSGIELSKFACIHQENRSIDKFIIGNMRTDGFPLVSVTSKQNAHA
jgi:hypothetical protein